MKKRMILCLAITLVFLCLSSCSNTKIHYDEDRMLGKTSAEIVAEFGEFDCVGQPAGADGLYRNTRCGYTIQESEPGFLDEREELLFFVHFDENGVAYDWSEGQRPGG